MQRTQHHRTQHGDNNNSSDLEDAQDASTRLMHVDTSSAITPIYLGDERSGERLEDPAGRSVLRRCTGQTAAGEYNNNNMVYYRLL